jgi:hypothetical protein
MKIPPIRAKRECFVFRVSCFVFRVSCFEFRGSRFEVRVSSFEVLPFRQGPEGFCRRSMTCGYENPAHSGEKRMLRVSCFEFRVSSFVFRVSCFEFRVSSFVFRVSSPAGTTLY